MVTSFSSIHSPPATQLYRIRKTDATVEGIVLSPAGWLHETKRTYLFNNMGGLLVKLLSCTYLGKSLWIFFTSNHLLYCVL